MVGMIPLGRVSAAGDLTTASNIDNDLTESAQAVERRIRDSADPLVAEAISESNAIRDAVENVVEEVLDLGGLSLANVSTDTDGVPYYDPGSDEYFAGFDVDGVPYLIPAGA